MYSLSSFAVATMYEVTVSGVGLNGYKKPNSRAVTHRKNPLLAISGHFTPSLSESLFVQDFWVLLTLNALPVTHSTVQFISMLLSDSVLICHLLVSQNNFTSSLSV